MQMQRKPLMIALMAVGATVALSVSVSAREVCVEPGPVPAYMVQIKSEASADEAVAETAHQTESPVSVSGRHGGLGILPKAYTLEEEAEWSALACAIYNGAGGADPELMRMIADVALNRVEDNRFPGTLLEVLQEPGQFGTTWPEGVDMEEKNLAYIVAREVLFEGIHSGLYGARYIWASGEEQGVCRIQVGGVWFGK